MDKLENLKNVEQLLVDTESLSTTLQIMYYKKKLNEVEKYKSVEEIDMKFRQCRDLLKDNIKKIKYELELNYNLFLALGLHLSVMANEIKKLEDINDDEIINEVRRIEDSTDTSSDSSSDDEVGKAVKEVLSISNLKI